MSYKYKKPEDKGYKKIKISRKEIKKILRNASRFSKKYEVYEDDKRYYIEILAPLYVKILVTILYPIALLSCGISNFNELNKEIYRTWNQKKTGSFYSEFIYKDRLKQDSINETLSKIK